MKKSLVKKIIVGLVAVAVIIPGASAFAWKGKNSGGHHGAMMANLSEEQVTELTELKKSFYEDTKDIRQSMHEKKLELQLVMVKDPVNVKDAKKLQKEISSLKAKMADKRIDYIIKAKAISPELGKMGFMGKGKGRNNCGKGAMMGSGMRDGCPNY